MLDRAGNCPSNHDAWKNSNFLNMGKYMKGLNLLFSKLKLEK